MDPRVEDIRRAIRSFKDFPKKGILFRDVLPIFHNPDVFRKLIDVLAEQVRSSVPDVSAVVGIEARGFIIAPALALALNVAFVPVRKPGKLPGTVKSQAYTLEYGEDKLEVQEDGFLKGRKVVIVDDLLATGVGLTCLGTTVFLKFNCDRPAQGRSARFYENSVECSSIKILRITRPPFTSRKGAAASEVI
ncbi:adenine phosphoribosyltransferase, putative [Ixodes scapularis]|uniref:adenine phosphoribosyltransferase n=1 Tax=Ixodes scapularis TaxID=6945 RepID=B7Q9G6_IXOSC|nr:adenine phosphoribosyltransferase, putative [Ixodes scapularis]|eukprot:XP_002405887.1 adenine phosphoribosyltransferase, putative [Ixodes scapularis]